MWSAVLWHVSRVIGPCELTFGLLASDGLLVSQAGCFAAVTFSIIFKHQKRIAVVFQGFSHATAYDSRREPSLREGRSSSLHLLCFLLSSLGFILLSTVSAGYNINMSLFPRTEMTEKPYFILNVYLLKGDGLIKAVRVKVEYCRKQ